MSLTIIYHDPGRPNEAGITMIAAQSKAAEIIAQLEKRGLVVDKITHALPRRGLTVTV